MNKLTKACLAEIVLLIVVFTCFRPVLGWFNIYDEKNAGERNIIHVRMLDDPDKRSYGNEMRILYVKVNGKNIDLSAYDTSDWVWHGEWGYTLFTSGDHDFSIKIDEKIKTLDFCYIKQEGSGKCEIYLNDHLEKKLDMYSSKWKNGNLFVSFLSRKSMIFRGLEIWVLLSLLLYLCYRACKLWNSQVENNEYKIGLGTFNLAKGLGIFWVVLIHSGLCVLTEADVVSGSFIAGVLFVFLTYGLMPAFFMLGGYGRKTRKTSAGILTNLKEMMLPYVIIALIIAVCRVIKVFAVSDYDLAELKKDIISLTVMLIHDKDINGDFYKSIGPLWFTTSFALGSILFSLLLKIRKNAVRYIVLLVMLAVTGFLMSLDFSFFCVTTGMMAALYMYAGQVIYQKKLIHDNIRANAVLLLLIPVVILLALLNGTSFAISGNNMGSVFILGVAVSMITAVIYISVSISLNSSFLGRIRAFGMTGRYSYHIFFAHALEYMIIPWNEIAGYLPENKALRIFMIFIMRCIVIALFTAVFLRLSKIKRIRNAG